MKRTHVTEKALQKSIFEKMLPAMNEYTFHCTCFEQRPEISPKAVVIAPCIKEQRSLFFFRNKLFLRVCAL